METVISPDVDPSPPRSGWRSLLGLGHAVVALLATSVVSAVALAAATVAAAAALDDARESAGIGAFGAAMDATGVVGHLYGVWFLLYAATGVTFIVWLFRAAKNDDDLGRPARHQPGWAIAGWFVPFANFVLPYQVVSDLWQGRGKRRRTALVWWLSLLAGGSLLSFGLVAIFGEVPMGTTTTAQRANVVALAMEKPHGSGGALTVGLGLALLVLAALLAIRLVRGISSQQRDEAVVGGVVVNGDDDADAPPSRAGRWWAALPAGAAVLFLLVALPLRADHADAVTAPDAAEPFGEPFVDPEGLYELRIDPAWVALPGMPTAEEGFAVGTPRGEQTPYVLITSGADGRRADAGQFADEAIEVLSPQGFRILADGPVADSGGALAFVEWTNPAGEHGYSVFSVAEGTWVIAEFIAPSSSYEELLVDVQPYLHTLRPTT